MRQVTNYLGLALIVGGLLLTSVPLARWVQAYYYQSQALAALEEAEEEKSVVDAVPPLEKEQPTPNGLPAVNGIIEIPKINLQAVVVQGVTEEHLKQGPGFYPQSKYPEVGNVSIAAHRGVYGSWFRNVDKLDPGDEITLMIGDAVYRYHVREQFVTDSRDWSVVESGDLPELTLTTCLFTTTTKRLIVKADLVQIEKAPQPQRFERQ